MMSIYTPKVLSYPVTQSLESATKNKLKHCYFDFNYLSQINDGCMVPSYLLTNDEKSLKWFRMLILKLFLIPQERSTHHYFGRLQFQPDPQVRWQHHHQLYRLEIGRLQKAAKILKRLYFLTKNKLPTRSPKNFNDFSEKKIKWKIDVKMMLKGSLSQNKSFLTKLCKP